VSLAIAAGAVIILVAAACYWHFGRTTEPQPEGDKDQRADQRDKSQNPKEPPFDPKKETELVKGAAPPVEPDTFPDPASIPGLPSLETVSAKPVIDDPARVYLEYRNGTDRDLQLLVLDCSAYYARQRGTVFVRQPWLSWPFPSTKHYERYNGFRGGTGWYCFMVLEKGKKPVFIGARNLYMAEHNRLTVTSDGSKYFAHFE
jgi:hypothetical protein